MVSDAYIRYAHDMLTKLASDFGQPVYSYQFEYQGRYSHEYIPGTQTPFGKLAKYMTKLDRKLAKESIDVYSVALK